jgi:hypothetical protein
VYSSGKTVRWIGPAESEEPAPRVALVAAEEEDEAATGGGAGDGTEVQGAQVEDGSPLSVMDWIALAVSLAALALAGAAFARRRTA